MAELSLIDDIRAASRLMVRELGFMDATVAASDYPPSAAIRSAVARPMPLPPPVTRQTLPLIRSPVGKAPLLIRLMAHSKTLARAVARI